MNAASSSNGGGHRGTRWCFSDAPAKVNLVLRVLGRRPDGYHELNSLAIGVGLHDRLWIEEAESSGIHLTCDELELANDDNLVTRAIRELAARHAKTPALRVHLAKRVPIAAGLGGGSSDAAAALRICNRLWGLDRTLDELADIGSAVGSDVPLFFHLPAAHMTGRGEVVTPVTLRWTGWILLVTVPVSVSTASVYASWRREDHGEQTNPSVALTAETAEVLREGLYNDLEPAVFRVAPEVGRVKRYLAESGCGAFLVSGAGSTLFRLFDTWDAAHQVQQVLVETACRCNCVLIPAPVDAGLVIQGE